MAAPDETEVFLSLEDDPPVEQATKATTPVVSIADSANASEASNKQADEELPALEADADGVMRGSPSGFVLQLGEEGPRALLGRRLLSQRVARLASLLDHGEETVATARLIDLRYADRAVLLTVPASG